MSTTAVVPVRGACAMIGVLLAGGSGSRMAGVAPNGKALAPFAGRTLAERPLATLAAVCDRIAIACKPDTSLEGLPAVERWDEPPEPRHPLTGIVHALERAGAPVLVCAADMPFVTPEACRSLLSVAARAESPATVAVAGGVLQPTLAVYAPAALEPLRAFPDGERLTDAVEALRPARVALPEPVVRSVDTPDELAAAEHELFAG